MAVNIFLTRGNYTIVVKKFGLKNIKKLSLILIKKKRITLVRTMCIGMLFTQSELR